MSISRVSYNSVVEKLSVQLLAAILTLGVIGLPIYSYLVMVPKLDHKMAGAVEVDNIKNVNFGITPADPKEFISSRPNIFELVQQYKLPNGVGVAHVRVYGKKSSRWYSAMTRLYFSPYSDNIVLQTGLNKMKTIEKDSFLYFQLISLSIRGKGFKVHLKNNHIESADYKPSDMKSVTKFLATKTK